MSATQEEENIISEVRQVRADNNDLWMNILLFALRASPAKTKAAISLIVKNDRKITGLLEKLGE